MSQDLLSFLDETQVTDRPKPAPQKTEHDSDDRPDQRHPQSGRYEFWDVEVEIQRGYDRQREATIDQAGLDDAKEDDDDFGDFEIAPLEPPPTASTVPVEVTVEQHPKPSPPKPKPPAKVPPTRTPFPLKAAPKLTKPTTLDSSNAASTRSPFPPKAAPKPTKSNIPISPKPPAKETTGSHPFAGRMDLLFEADGDDYDAGADDLGDLSNNPEAAMAYSKRLIAEQEERAKSSAKGKQVAVQRGGFVDLEEVKAGRGGREGVEKGNGKAKVKDPNVLFDADDVSDDGVGGEEDDFGDFETWDAPATTAIPAWSESQVEAMSAGTDLLGLDDQPRQARMPKAAQTRSNAPTKKALPQNGNVKPSASSSTTQQQDDDLWDDFESTSSAPKQHPAPLLPQQDDTWPDFDTPAPAPAHSPPEAIPTTKSTSQPPKASKSQADITPPTNIPPPHTLLTLFSPIFSAADSALFAALSKLDLKSRTMLLSHPASHQFLRGYLSQITVLARIIAGRKLRWKRDQRLSQGMRIGPSIAGGGKGGMKLAGLDKSEVAKEDREVLDTVNLYRAQLGKLRSAVTAANAAPGLPKLPAVPEIQETMPVKALKQGEGGVMAREACALCGLKREERVVRVDEGVEDSFGEWWVQVRGMHVGCWGFWEQHERKLKSR